MEQEGNMATSHRRRSSLPNNRGQARLGYIYASPLVQTRPNSGGRKDRMELLDTAQVSMGRQKSRQQTAVQWYVLSAMCSNLASVTRPDLSNNLHTTALEYHRDGKSVVLPPCNIAIASVLVSSVFSPVFLAL